jgi:hypothetical protein
MRDICIEQLRDSRVARPEDIELFLLTFLSIPQAMELIVTIGTQRLAIPSAVPLLPAAVILGSAAAIDALVCTCVASNRSDRSDYKEQSQSGAKHRSSPF